MTSHVPGALSSCMSALMMLTVTAVDVSVPTAHEVCTGHGCWDLDNGGHAEYASLEVAIEASDLMLMQHKFRHAELHQKEVAAPAKAAAKEAEAKMKAEPAKEAAKDAANGDAKTNEPAEKTEEQAAPEAAATDGNATSTMNATENVTANATANDTVCATKHDDRARAWFAETSPVGTPCVFGVDPRDEGSHCIYENGDYGSNGFCWTNEDKSAWGSCNEYCPLYGQPASLGKKLDGVADSIHEVIQQLKTSEPPAEAKDAGKGASAEGDGAKEAPKEQAKDAELSKVKAKDATK